MLTASRGRLPFVNAPARFARWRRMWAYTGATKRDLRLDLLRGFCLFAMFVDHLAGPSVLYRLTGGNNFYVSAAEGFVFISGLLLGITYRKTIERHGFRAAITKALRRAASLYALMVALTLAFNITAAHIGLSGADLQLLKQPLTFIWSIVALRRAYWLTDILTMYMLLVAAAPLALWLIRRRKTGLLLAASWLLWFVYQRYPTLLTRPLPATESFPAAAWQIFFIHALALGYHRERIAKFFTAARRRYLFATSGALLVLLLLVTYRQGFLLDQLFGVHAGPWLEAITLKDDVRIGRIVAALIVFPFVYLLVTYLWQPLQRFLGWLLVPLGQHSLTGYALHLPLVLLTLRLAPDFGKVHLAQPSLNAIVQLGAILLVWLLVQWRALLTIAAPSQQLQPHTYSSR